MVGILYLPKVLSKLQKLESLFGGLMIMDNPGKGNILESISLISIKSEVLDLGIFMYCFTK